jgi:hypothetical protein
MLESALQLQSPAAYIFEIFPQQANDGIRGDGRTRFLKLLIVY